jgi:hypothetical protein
VEQVNIPVKLNYANESLAKYSEHLKIEIINFIISSVIDSYKRGKYRYVSASKKDI